MMSKIIKKLATGVFALAATLLIAAPTKANAAEIPLKVTTGNSIQECGDNLAINEETLLIDKKTPHDYVYSFHISKASIVKINMHAEDVSGDSYTLIGGRCGVYTDKALTKPVSMHNNPEKNTVDLFGDFDKFTLLKPGTYYIEIHEYAYDSYTQVDSGEAQVKIIIQSIPVDKAYSLKYSVKGGKLRGSFKNNVTDWLPITCMTVEKNPNTDSIYLCTQDEMYSCGKTFSYACSDFSTKGKSLVFRLCKSMSSVGFCFDSYVDILINPDVYAPQITGFKSGATYKKAVVVKYKDASKVKSATVNGKTFKSGTKFKKPGHYTITVKDVIGNKRTASFTIKK